MDDDVLRFSEDLRIQRHQLKVKNCVKHGYFGKKKAQSFHMGFSAKRLTRPCDTRQEITFKAYFRGLAYDKFSGE